MSDRSDPGAVLDALDRAHEGVQASRGDPRNRGTQRPLYCGHRAELRSRRTIHRGVRRRDGRRRGNDFRDHEYSYDRAHQLGLFEPETAEEMRELYSENRTESYYGGGEPTDHQAEAMADLARSVHDFVVDQIREGGVCVCDTGGSS